MGQLAFHARSTRVSIPDRTWVGKSVRRRRIPCAMFAAEPSGWGNIAWTDSAEQIDDEH